MRLFDPFVNYARDPARRSPINVAAARVILGLVLVWKVLSLDWAAIGTWPVPIYERHEPFLLPELTIPFLPVEKWVLVAALLGFTLGYRTRLTSFVSALLMTHMAGLRLPINPSGGTEALFIATYFVLFFGLYSDQDALSVDGLRRVANTPVAEIDHFLRSEETRSYRMSALRWCLLVMAILYFTAGLQKVLSNPGLTWTVPDSLARYMTMNAFADHDYRPVAELLSSDPLFLSAAAWGTLVLEMGLLVVALAGLTITPVVLGLMGLHVGIGLALDPFFFDFVVFLGLFAAYDRVLSRFAWDRPISVVYDSRHPRTVRLFWLFKHLDLNDALSFTPRADVTRRDGDRLPLDSDAPSALSVVVDEEQYEGSRALCVLAESHRLLAPVVSVARTPPLRFVSARLYRYVTTAEVRTAS